MARIWVSARSVFRVSVYRVSGQANQADGIDDGVKQRIIHVVLRGWWNTLPPRIIDICLPSDPHAFLLR